MKVGKPGSAYNAASEPELWPLHVIVGLLKRIQTAWLSAPARNAKACVFGVWRARTQPESLRLVDVQSQLVRVGLREPEGSRSDMALTVVCGICFCFVLASKRHGLNGICTVVVGQVVSCARGVYRRNDSWGIRDDRRGYCCDGGCESCRSSGLQMLCHGDRSRRGLLSRCNSRNRLHAMSRLPHVALYAHNILLRIEIRMIKSVTFGHRICTA